MPAARAEVRSSSGGRQSRAYLIAAFGCALLGTILAGHHQRLPNLKFALVGGSGLPLIVVGVLLR